LLGPVAPVSVQAFAPQYGQNAPSPPKFIPQLGQRRAGIWAGIAPGGAAIMGGCIG